MKLSTLCDGHECQYSKDVSMPEYRCVGKCQYSDTDCQYLLDILDDLRSLDGLSEEDENAIAGIRARLGGYSPEELS